LPAEICPPVTFLARVAGIESPTGGDAEPRARAGTYGSRPWANFSAAERKIADFVLPSGIPFPPRRRFPPCSGALAPWLFCHGNSWIAPKPWSNRGGRG